MATALLLILITTMVVYYLRLGVVAVISLVTATALVFGVLVVFAQPHPAGHRWFGADRRYGGGREHSDF